MAINTDLAPGVVAPTGSKNRVWERLWGDRTAQLALVVLGILMLAIALGPILYSGSPSTIDFARAFLPPGVGQPLGTNDLGQDQLARLLIGGRISLAVGLAATLVGISLGVAIGALAGFCGGWVDVVLMRVTDLFLALPQLPLVLLVVYLLGDPVRRTLGPERGIFLLIVLLIGGLSWMSVARLVRAGFLSLRQRTFVQAAVALGARPWGIVKTHLLPNILGPVIVAATIGVGNALLAESTLSFLGVGFPPDVPTWGRMLYDAQNYIESAPYLVLSPGMAIFLTVLCINTLGDRLRDSLDPTSR
ncbi:ABC transporter permease [Phormidium tenue]|uniref:Peptide ABC transporter permease n=1 Tax=Phormidium tenue NIES-30 TaxID=549789 RepID=A0A1U7JAM6_9CYAN|nr:ABC transporter permease [Phormidium tenue]MBD2230447.1 ABC transporter permease [Phormidium tenue FACHB-1052]OKH50762.1 peptide ABC transporter permease [Phormidium tenue NIES-30]